MNGESLTKPLPPNAPGTAWEAMSPISKNRIWSDILRQALLANNGEKLQASVEAVIAAAIGGDISAANHIADRLDGKVKQVIIHEGDKDAPLTVQFTASAALAQKIRGILHSGDGSASNESQGKSQGSSDPTVFRAGQNDSAGSRARETQRANTRLPTRQVVVKGDALEDFRGGGEQPLEP